MKALKTVPVRIPIDIQGTEDLRVVDGGEYTRIYLYSRQKGVHLRQGRTNGNNLII